MISGLPGVILEAHFGILEAPGRPKNHIRGSKSKKGRFSVPKWPSVAPSAPKSPPRTPQGRPKGAPRDPKMEGKSF